MTPMRVRNWDVDLVRWGSALAGEPYEWGRTDCGTLARGALAVLYGADPLHGASWKGPVSAGRWMTAAGGLDALLARLRATEVARGFAQAGDLVVLGGDHDGLPRFAVMLNASTALVSNPDDGVVAAPLAQLEPEARIWRLPA